jgi:hypothetical protein
LFEVVFEATTSAVSRQVGVAAAAAVDVWDTMSIGTEAYFEACSAGAMAHIVLKDGPALLGWERWRKIDAAHFARPFRRCSPQQ